MLRCYRVQATHFSSVLPVYSIYPVSFPMSQYTSVTVAVSCYTVHLYSLSSLHVSNLSVSCITQVSSVQTASSFPQLFLVFKKTLLCPSYIHPVWATHYHVYSVLCTCVLLLFCSYSSIYSSQWPRNPGPAFWTLFCDLPTSVCCGPFFCVSCCTYLVLYPV
jgi:hypothetical protein